MSEIQIAFSKCLPNFIPDRMPKIKNTFIILKSSNKWFEWYSLKQCFLKCGKGWYSQIIPGGSEEDIEQQKKKKIKTLRCMLWLDIHLPFKPSSLPVVCTSRGFSSDSLSAMVVHTMVLCLNATTWSLLGKHGQRPSSFYLSLFSASQHSFE